MELSDDSNSTLREYFGSSTQKSSKFTKNKNDF
jgi:hypothetical protein